MSPLAPHRAHVVSSPFWLWCGGVCTGSGEAAQIGDFWVSGSLRRPKAGKQLVLCDCAFYGCGVNTI